MTTHHKNTLADLATGQVIDYDDRVKGPEGSLFTKDPASFFMVFNVLNRVRESITEFQSFLADRPELRVILDKTLAKMKAAGFIDFDGDKIVVLRPNPLLDMRTSDFELFPKLLGTVARRIRENYLKDPKQAFRDSDELFWRTLPDHPKVRARLFHLTNKFTAEVDALTEEVLNDPEIKAERVRLFSFMSGNLEPEDFK